MQNCAQQPTRVTLTMAESSKQGLYSTAWKSCKSDHLEGLSLCEVSDLHREDLGIHRPGHRAQPGGEGRQVEDDPADDERQIGARTAVLEALGLGATCLPGWDAAPWSTRGVQGAAERAPLCTHVLSFHPTVTDTPFSECQLQNAANA